MSETCAIDSAIAGLGDAIEIVSEKTANAVETQDMNSSKVVGDNCEAKENCVQQIAPVLQNGANSENDENDTNAQDEQEALLLQENGFTVKIHAPAIDPFELIVTPTELIQEIYQVLMDREETCCRTCFSLQVEGQTLDNFTEVKTIEKLKEGAEVKVVEEPYTGREARLHVKHIRDLLRSLDLDDAYMGVDGASLSFVNVVTNGNITEKKVTPGNMDCTPPDYIMPSMTNRPLEPLHPTGKEAGGIPCVKVLTPSAWNPPPPQRRLQGDLLYVRCVTLEEKQFQLTVCPRGFYLNQSTVSTFDPSYVSPKIVYHSLVDLLGHISPMFKKNFQQLLKRRMNRHPYERVPCAVQIYSWLGQPCAHPEDAFRAEEAFSTRLGYEEHIPGQTRDWNDEIQTTRELPRKLLAERLLRERAMFKVYGDFVIAATRGAMAVVDGNIMPINPGEEAKMQMFLWNNIFFSLGFDVKDHYKDFGGDYAAHAAPRLDLQGVKAYSQLDTQGLHTLGTVLIDYRGFRVTAQSIIPGILERDQEQSVVYGSIDFGKTITCDDKYREVLCKTAQSLKIRPHKMLSTKEDVTSEVELFTSVECKGILGNDKRMYFLDLIRTSPPDPNYLMESLPDCPMTLQSFGFPRSHRHRMVTLRPELIEHFCEQKYLEFLHKAAAKFQKVKKEAAAHLGQEEDKKEEKKEEKEADASEMNEDQQKEADDKTDEILSHESAAIKEAQKMVKSPSEYTRDVVRECCLETSSVSMTEFHMSFNPDLYQPNLQHADVQSAEYQLDKKRLWEVTEFLVLHQIPAFVKDCSEQTICPMDCFGLSEALHQYGVNMRYLGLVAEKLGQGQHVEHCHALCVTELVTRSIKHIYDTYMSSVGSAHQSAAVSHFLNCILGSYPSPTPAAMEEPLQPTQVTAKGHRRSRKSKNRRFTDSNSSTDWANETPRSMWKKLLEDIEACYHFKLEGDGIDACVDVYGLNKMVLLRAVCKRLGIQLILRNYTLDHKGRSTFAPEDILNLFPVVKTLHPRATDAYQVFIAGQTRIQQGLLREGHDMVSEALNLLTNVYGAMHPEIAACHRLLARLNYIMGDYPEALSLQHRATVMSERVLGIDHPETIREFGHLALYCFANQQVAAALKLMYRARYLSLLCHGEDHPNMALCDSNIGLVLHSVREYDLSLKFLQKALDVNIRFLGRRSLKVAFSYHLMARSYACLGDFRAALNMEKEAFSISKEMLGDDNEKTRESQDFLRRLTTEAVNWQKTMNQISRGHKVNPALATVQMQPPPMQHVLEMLNTINGIVFIHISPEELEVFRRQLAAHRTPDMHEIEVD